MIFAFKRSKRILNFNFNLKFKFKLLLIFNINFQYFNNNILLDISFINFKILFLISKILFPILKISLRIFAIVFFIEIIKKFNEFNNHFFDLFLIDNNKNFRISNLSRLNFNIFKNINKKIKNNF